jgi:hypothetical protein|eukprot:COSAG03_NODE_18_length_21685_cov_15.938988_4_plen_41_part_00
MLVHETTTARGDRISITFVGEERLDALCPFAINPIRGSHV